MGTVLLVILIIILLGGLPTWGPGPYGWHGYGWYPSGGLGIIVVILVLLLLAGRL